MLRRIFQTAPYRCKNLLVSSNNWVKKCSTASAAEEKSAESVAQETPPTSSSGVPPAEPGRPAGRGTGGGAGFIRGSSAETVYDFFKRLVNGHRSIQSRGILLKALSGVVASNRDMEFVDLYFDQWWRQWTTSLEHDNVMTQRNLLSTAVVQLGKINVRTNGELGRSFQPKIFQFIQSKFDVADTTGSTKRDLACFYIGLGNLASTQHVFKERLINDELLTKTLASFKEAVEKGTENKLDLVYNYSAILNSLPKIKAVLKREDLEFATKFFKSVFDDAQQFAAAPGSSTDRATYDFYKKAQILYCFANAYLEWHVNPNDLCENIWSSWYAALKNLLKINLNLEYPALRRRNEPGGETDGAPTANRRTLASEAVSLCIVAADAATKFNLEKNLHELNDVWMPVLHKNVFQATADSVLELANAIRRAQLVLQAKAALQNKNDETPRLVDDALEITIARRADAHREYLRRKSERSVDRRGEPPPLPPGTMERGPRRAGTRDEYFDDGDNRSASYQEFNYRY